MLGNCCIWGHFFIKSTQNNELYKQPIHRKNTLGWPHLTQASRDFSTKEQLLIHGLFIILATKFMRLPNFKCIQKN